MPLKWNYHGFPLRQLLYRCSFCWKSSSSWEFQLEMAKLYFYAYIGSSRRFIIIVNFRKHSCPLVGIDVLKFLGVKLVCNQSVQFDVSFKSWLQTQKNEFKHRHIVSHPLNKFAAHQFCDFFQASDDFWRIFLLKYIIHLKNVLLLNSIVQNLRLQRLYSFLFWAVEMQGEFWYEKLSSWPRIRSSLIPASCAAIFIAFDRVEAEGRHNPEIKS